jgi:hypothetical protein
MIVKNYKILQVASPDYHRNEYMEGKFHRENKTIRFGQNTGQMGNFSTVEFPHHIFISMVNVIRF